MYLHNAKWSIAVPETVNKLDQLSNALRAQAMHHLLNVDRSWEASWQVDDRSNEVTEAGPIAQNLKDFRVSLLREKRWICGLGWQALSNIKRVGIVIFQLRESGWARISKFIPAEVDRMFEKDKDKAMKALTKIPIVPVALQGGHYFAILRSRTPFPQEWITQPLSDTKTEIRAGMQHVEEGPLPETGVMYSETGVMYSPASCSSCGPLRPLKTKSTKMSLLCNMLLRLNSKSHIRLTL